MQSGGMRDDRNYIDRVIFLKSISMVTSAVLGR